MVSHEEIPSFDTIINNLEIKVVSVLSNKIEKVAIKKVTFWFSNKIGFTFYI